MKFYDSESDKKTLLIGLFWRKIMNHRSFDCYFSVSINGNSVTIRTWTDSTMLLR